jgi:quercetin dioxygenase-like cupin family protein
MAKAEIPGADALLLAELVTPTERGIASRVLARTAGGNLTLFAFDAGQGLEEHSSPFDALVLVLSGALELRIGGAPVRATPGTIVRMPGGIPHALEAPEPTRMLLVMLREPVTAPAGAARP